MKQYRVTWPGGFVHYALAASFTITIGVVLFSPSGEPEGLPVLFLALFWAGMSSWAWYSSLCYPVEITVEETGRVHFRSPIRRQSLDATDILSIKTRRLGLGVVDLRHRGGTIHLISSMDGFHDLIGTLKAKNPCIEMDGYSNTESRVQGGDVSRGEAPVWKRYRVAKSILVFEYARAALLFPLGGVFFFFFPIPGTPAIVAIVPLSGLGLFMWYISLRYPVEITVDESGRVYFRSPIRQVTLDAKDIQSIKAGAFFTWEVCIEHRGGFIDLKRRMEGFNDFVATLKSINPAIEVKGC